MKRLACVIHASVFLFLGASTGRADFVELTPVQTDTLIESPGGNAMSGLFAGLSGDGSGRQRGLLEFDIAAILPPCATIQSVTLNMTLESVGHDKNGHPILPVTISLYDATTAWNGSTTWNSPSWTNPGGDFSSTASASYTDTTGTVGTTFSWSSSQMAADLQNWLNDPSANFGWFVIGDEKHMNSVRRFYSDSITLDITYTACPEPASAMLLAIGTVAVGLGARRRSKR